MIMILIAVMEEPSSQGQLCCSEDKDETSETRIINEYGRASQLLTSDGLLPCTTNVRQIRVLRIEVRAAQSHQRRIQQPSSPATDYAIIANNRTKENILESEVLTRVSWRGLKA